MTELDKKKKQVDLIKISAAIAELEMKIMERQEDIERMRDHIEKQKQRQVELEKELKE